MSEVLTKTEWSPEQIKALEDEVAGRWPEFMEDAVPNILTEAMANLGEHVSCPGHGGSDGFRLFPNFAHTGGGICNTCGGKGKGLKMLAWLKGYGYYDAVEELALWLKKELDCPTPSRRPPPPPPPPRDIARAKENIRKVWLSSKPLLGSAAEKYLSRRGIWPINMPPVLRSHDSLLYYDSKQKKVLGNFPAMLAPVKDKDGTLVTIHRTFITPDGMKAPVPEVKKLMERIKDLNGAAIKLFQPTNVLGVGEGIETMLAVHAITRLPVWSCINAILLEQVEIPASVEHVVIWGDKDRKGAGQRSAEKLADRLCDEGKTVEVIFPEKPIPENEKGIDWLDVLNQYGLLGFPERWRIWKDPV